MTSSKMTSKNLCVTYKVMLQRKETLNKNTM
jgi:hypothetical protein